MACVRDYQALTRRLRALPAADWQVEQVGRVWGYPFFRLQRTVAPGAPTILLAGGIHGEEPASVAGVLRWLEDGGWRRWPINWFVLPCINPYGWERNQRRNAQRRDINRQFYNASVCPEARLIKRLVAGRRFLFSIEFHEDVDAAGYYLYELLRTPPVIGEKIVQAVSRVVPINRCRVIDGWPATGLGLIRRDPGLLVARRRRRWPMAFHVFQHCTDHVLGSETPVGAPLAQRVRAHLVALRTALKHLAGASCHCRRSPGLSP